MITQELLEEILEYKHITGELTWKIVANNNGATIGDTAGTVSRYGYRKIVYKRKEYSEHRLAWALYYGKFPDGEIDHINHNKVDNRIDNLRDVDRAKNMRNKSKYKNNKTGFTGVEKRGGPYIACFRRGGRIINLGSYKNLSDAVKARVDAEQKHGFHTNHGY